MKFLKLLAIVFLFAGCVAAQTEIVRVKLAGVSDGDTITVTEASKRHFRVRLIGIDAPELNQKFGDDARKRLKKVLKSDKKNILVVPFGLDRYNRILVRIFVGDLDVNLELLRSGAAWFYDSPEMKSEDLRIYREAFETAKSERRGLFAQADAEEPKLFRRKRRRN